MRGTDKNDCNKSTRPLMLVPRTDLTENCA